MRLLEWKRLDTGMLLPISGAEATYSASRFVKCGVRAGIEFQDHSAVLSNGLPPADTPLLWSYSIQGHSVPLERYATAPWLNRGVNGQY